MGAGKDFQRRDRFIRSNVVQSPHAFGGECAGIVVPEVWVLRFCDAEQDWDRPWIADVLQRACKVLVGMMPVCFDSLTEDASPLSIQPNGKCQVQNQLDLIRGALDQRHTKSSRHKLPVRRTRDGALESSTGAEGRSPK